MEIPQTSTPPPSQYTPPSPAPKKGLGTGAKVGIGCGVIVVLAIIGMVIGGIMLGGKLKNFADNPTRSTAELMVTASVGTMEMVAQDDAKKRYTVKEKSSGKLTTIYWDEIKKTPEVISGDFSAIPSNSMTIEPEPVPDSGSAPETDQN